MQQLFVLHHSASKTEAARRATAAAAKLIQKVLVRSKPVFSSEVLILSDEGSMVGVGLVGA
jgi:hypothetical protein